MELVGGAEHPAGDGERLAEERPVPAPTVPASALELDHLPGQVRLVRLDQQALRLAAALPEELLEFLREELPEGQALGGELLLGDLASLVRVQGQVLDILEEM